MNEGSTGRYTGTVVDDAGNPVQGPAVTSILLTWYDETTGEIINGRRAQQCIPTGATGVSMHATSGLLTWLLSTLDSAIVVGTKARETHVGLFVITATIGGVVSTVVHEARIEIENVSETIAP